MKALENIGFWAAVLGAAGFLGGYVITMLKTYQHIFAMLFIGGAVVWIVAKIL